MHQNLTFYVCLTLSYNGIFNIQWQIQEFLNRVRGSEVVKFVGTGDCFDVPLHIPYR